MKYGFPDDKKRQEAEQIWNEVLSNSENYSRNHEDLGNITFTEVIFRRIETSTGIYFYTNEVSTKGIRAMASILSSVPEIHKASSFDNIHKSITNEIRNRVLLVSSLKDKSLFEDIEKSIFNHIFSCIKNYSYYFPVDGIVLEENMTVDFGAIQILKFGLDEMNYLLDQNPEITAGSEYIYRKYIDESLLGKVCIKCSCVGDQGFAEKVARYRSGETINYLRYILCLYSHERIKSGERISRINFSSEAFVDANLFLCREMDTNILSFHYGTKRTNVRGQDFPLNDQHIIKLKEEIYYDLIVRIINDEERTDLENRAMTSINWTGEAQNDFNRDTSFLKYWTALECFFPEISKKDEKKSVTQRISTGIPILFTDLGGYNFAENNHEILDVCKTICVLYQKRGYIIHDGLRNEVSEIELAEICRITCWVILCMLYLISEGNTCISQIDKEIKNRYGALPEEIQSEMRKASSKNGSN